MAGKQDAVHVKRFALIPIGNIKQTGNAGYLRFFTGLHFDPNTLIFGHGQQVINDIKTQWALRVINAAQINQLREGTFVVAQELSSPPQYGPD